MQLPGLVPLGAKTEAIPATGRITRGRNQLRDSQSCLACMVMLVLLGRYWMFILYQRHRHCKMRHHAAHSPGTVAWGVHQIHGWQVDNTNILFVQRGEEHVPEVSRPEARCCQECDQSKQPLPTAHMQPPTSREKCLHRSLSLSLPLPYQRGPVVPLGVPTFALWHVHPRQRGRGIQAQRQLVWAYKLCQIRCHRSQTGPGQVHRTQ